MTPPSNKGTQQRLIGEIIWLPTYLGVLLLLLSSLNGGIVRDVVILMALFGCRFVLELTYRITFGDARLETRTKLWAFGSQLIVWGLIWAWHFQQAALVGVQR